MTQATTGYSAEAQAIIDANREYSLFSWSVQSQANPIPVRRAKGVYFWDVDGKRYLDFSAQLMNINIGHGHPRVIEAIKKQAEELCFVHPAMATDVRAEAARKLAEVAPHDLKKSFFTLGGSEAVENAMKMARLVTGRQKIITRYRSYHGATFGAMAAGGDPRRIANEPGVGWIVRMHDPYPFRNPIYRHCTPEEGDAVLIELLSQQIEMEGPKTIAGILLEGYSGSSGIMPPSTPAYWEGVRELCDRHGILLIIDEVMSGFGRTGRWFGIDHYPNVKPDLMAVAKGLTCGYVPLGATVTSEKVADHFENNPLWCGLTYSSYPVGCAAASACIDVYREDGLIENAEKMGKVLWKGLAELKDRHPCVGDHRGIGLFQVLELVKNHRTREPMQGFNKPATEPMAKVAKRLLELGLYTFVRWDFVFAVPPLCITPAELDEGLQKIDDALSLADPYVEG